MALRILVPIKYLIAHYQGRQVLAGAHQFSSPPLPSSFSHHARVGRQSQRFHVSHNHSAATECWTASFDQRITKEGFETKLIALEASCSVRAVSRTRRNHILSENLHSRGVLAVVILFCSVGQYAQFLSLSIHGFVADCVFPRDNSLSLSSSSQP